MKAASLILAATLFALPAAAYAHHDGGDGKHRPHGHHMMMRHHGPGPFEMLDTNHDGFISKAETLAHFNSIDANHDGKISKEEWRAHMMKRMKAHKGMMMGHHMKGERCHASAQPTGDWNYNH
jgi:hypothetical protein